METPLEKETTESTENTEGSRVSRSQKLPISWPLKTGLSPCPPCSPWFGKKFFFSHSIAVRVHLRLGG